jgi:cysteine desulfurase/selenocysteine lyase
VAVQQFVGAERTEEIVFTRGTTEALNLVALSWGRATLRAGDEIAVSEGEHHSNLVPWQMVAKETGAVVKWMPLRDDGTVDFSGIGKKTKLVAVAHVSNVTGVVHPIREIVKRAHEVGAVVVVDGAQAIGHQKVNVQELGCDFYAFSGHKCYGPTGVGVLYGKFSLLEQMPPVHGGGDMIAKVTLDETTFALPPLRFEAGTPLIGPVIALKSALDFINTIGLHKIAQHETQLHQALEQGLRTIPGLQILGTTPTKAPISTFHIDGVHPLDLATLLDLSHIAIRTGHLCAQPCLRRFGLESVARASIGVYNTMNDVERFLDRLNEVVISLNRHHFQ